MTHPDGEGWTTMGAREALIPGKGIRVANEQENTEFQDLLQSITHGFGACHCHPADIEMTDDGSMIPHAVHVCPQHSFLRESDEAGRTVEWTIPRQYGGIAPHTLGTLSNCVRRVDRLIFARRMRVLWFQQEQMGQAAPVERLPW